jgi:hypothetical protein
MSNKTTRVRGNGLDGSIHQLPTGCEQLTT